MHKLCWVVTCQGQGHPLRSNSYIYRSKLTWTFGLASTHRFFILDIHIWLIEVQNWCWVVTCQGQGQGIVQSEVQGRRLYDCDPTFGIHTRAAMLV